MKHDYTDEEIKEAENEAYRTMPVAKEHEWVKAFLDALPMKSAEPERPQSAEIASLKAALAESEKQFQAKVDEIVSLLAERDKWEADALRYCKNADFWRSEHDKAQAVAAVVTAQAIRRMEDVPVGELHRIWRSETSAGHRDLKAVRARLIAAAAKGEGQPVVVNEPPQDEGQPDLSGESEKQPEEPAWIPHDGGPCPLVDEEVEEFEFKIRQGGVSGCVFVPSVWEWSHDGVASDIIAYRVLRWKPGFGPEAKPLPITTLARDQIDMTPAMAEAAEAVLNEELKAQPTTSPGWTPAVGDVVRLKSGGPNMTVHHISKDGSIACTHNANGAFEFATLPAACLTPAQNP